MAVDLELRAALGGGQAVGGDVVDRLLAFLHARHVIGKRDALVCVGGREAQQFGQPLGVGVVLADTFFEQLPEVAPERCVLGLVGIIFAVGQRFEHAQHALGRALADCLHVAAFLQQLAAYVERQVGAVDDALDEAQVDRHQRLGVVHDEHALDVELDAAALVAIPQIERRLGRDVQQLRVFAAAFDAVVGVGQWVGGVVADLLVELLVLLFGDLALAARPQRSGLVDGRPFVLLDLLLGVGVPLFLLHQDGQRDVVRVLADDGLELPAGQKLLLALTQVQDDVGAALGAGDGLDLEVARTFGAPAHAFFGGGSGTAGLDSDAVGHDEAAVKAHAELTDQLRVFLLIALELGHEFTRTALGDGAQIGHGLFGAHADAVVADGDGLLVGVETQPHLEVGRVFIELGMIDGLETQLVAGIRRVGDQLAQEDFLVGIQRVGNEVQDLLDLGLKR